MPSSSDFCLCGFHVHHGTAIVGAFSILFGIISLLISTYIVKFGPDEKNSTGSFFDDKELIYKFGWGYTGTVYADIFLDGFRVVSAILMLIGQNKKRPKLYTPYLICSVIKIIGSVIGTTILFVLGVLALIIPRLINKDENYLTFAFGTLFLAFLFGGLTYSYGYFIFNVPIRSYRLLEREQQILFDQDPPVYTSYDNNSYV
ncbi:hypothetical protein M3Y97_01136500 [Aphelenchoides bicaudatus]|nr:hypothetical protein M3Y97_01136500 [Aphelenchoides bicaudatus]